jgi:hypothetical protein
MKIIFAEKNLNISGVPKPEYTSKTWGFEQTWENKQSSYCMKTLHILAGCNTSMHFHAHKDEHIMLVDGEADLFYIDEKGNSRIHNLVLFEPVKISRFFSHQITALQDSILVEASTWDDPEDSYRVQPTYKPKEF